MNKQSVLLAISSVFFGVAGVYCFLYPKDSLDAMGWYVGFVLVFSGISKLLRYMTGMKEVRTGWLLTGGVIDLAFGLWLWGSGNFVIMAALLPLFFAGYMVAHGILLMVYYYRQKRQVARPHLYVLSAVIQALLGVVLLAQPMMAAAVFVYTIGIGLLWCGFTNFVAWREVVRQ